MGINELTTRFEELVVDRPRLESITKSLERDFPKRVSEMPAVLKSFLDSQQSPMYFSDFVFVCSQLARSSDKEFEQFRLAYDGVDVSNLTLLEFIDLIEKGNGKRKLPNPFDGLYDVPSASIDMGNLDRTQKMVASYWHSCSAERKEGYRYLFDIELETGDFRKWLEEQRVTKDIVKEFKRLGLDYNLWDNPQLAWGVKNGVLEEIVSDEERIIEMTVDLSRKLTRGKYKGFLKVNPKDLWEQIKDEYQKVQRGEKVVERVRNLLDTYEANLRDSPKRKKNNFIRLRNEIEELRSLLDNEISNHSSNGYSVMFRVWQRKPSLDFYEGNDSGVCTAINGRNGEALANYLVDKSINLVDVVIDGKRYGQLYLVATHSNGEPVLLLDSLEASMDPNVQSRKQDLYEGTEKLVKELANKIGFKKIFVNANGYWRYSAGFLDYLMHKQGKLHQHVSVNIHGDTTEMIESTEYDSLTLSKVAGVEPIRELLAPIYRKHGNVIGRKHYLDVFSIPGQLDVFDWREDLHYINGKGLLL